MFGGGVNALMLFVANLLVMAAGPLKGWSKFVAFLG